MCAENGGKVTASDGTNTYAGSAHYAPQGALAYVQNGTNLYTTEIYNSRLQPCWIYSTTGSALTWNTTACTATDPGPANIIDLQYNFGLGAGDNGNVIGITNNRDTTRSQAFSYDALNRLLTAETTSTYSTSPTHCWGEAYFYDNQPSGSGAWGNLTSIGGASSSYTGCTQEGLSLTANTNNQISGFCYDAAGNLLQESTCPAGPPYTYAYNAEHQITSTGGVTYSYDGDGKRIEKSGGKIYWYGGGSSPLDETDLSGNTNNSTFSEYVYFGGARTSRRDYQGNIFYYFADHLGTSREMVQSGQTSPCYDADFYPFGGERAYTTTCTQNYKFTSKERDSESGLDYFGARHGSSSLGRFMSPDPSNLSVDFWMPRTWNRYTYVLNNPLSMVDRNGLWPWYIHNQIIDEAFPGLSKSELRNLKDTSAAVDKDQSPEGSYKHKMSNGDEVNTPEVMAEVNAHAFIEDNEELAQQIEADWLASGNTGIAPAALTAFGNALHTVTDGTSPAHEGYQPWYGTWHNLGLNALFHVMHEWSISPARKQAAVNAARRSFLLTFGRMAYYHSQDGLTPKVTHNIGPATPCGGEGQAPCS